MFIAGNDVFTVEATGGPYSQNHFHPFKNKN